MELALIGVGVFLGLVAAVLIGRHIIDSRRKQTEKVRAAQMRAQQGQDPLKQDIPSGGDPRTIQVGYLVEIWDYARGKLTFVVRGMITYDDGGYTWTEYFLDTGDGLKCWLSTESVGGDIEVFLWETVRADEISFNEDDAVYHGVVYQLDEEGTATYGSLGTTDVKSSGFVRYVDYKGPDGKWLCGERFDDSGTWEYGVGVAVGNELTIYPTSTPD